MRGTEKSLCRKVAIAICALDGACWHSTLDADRIVIEDVRRALFGIMKKHGYEFSKCDSARIRKAHIRKVKS
jgi:hypothetical protein